MERVDNLQHFDTLVKELKPNGKKVISNCFLLPGDISKITQQNRMHWERNTNGIIFLCEKQDFYKLYYYLLTDQIENAAINFEKQTKPVVIELVYTESNKPQSLAEIEKLWIDSSFCIYKIYRQTSMDGPLNESISHIKVSIDSDKYKIAYAQPEQYKDIQEIWRDNLGIFSAQLPFEDELIELLSNKQVYCVLDRDNKMVATQQIQRSGKVCTLSHGVCVESHRRSGLVRALIHTCMTDNKDITRYVSWVDENNLPARMFHKNIGLDFDGRVICQLVLK